MSRIYFGMIGMLGMCLLAGRLWADPAPATDATPLVLYVDYVNQQMSRMSLIHRQVQVYNAALNHYQATFPTDAAGRKAREAHAGGLTFSHPVSSEDIRLLAVRGTALREQLSALQGPDPTGSGIVSQYDQLDRTWARIIGICGELESHMGSGAYRESPALTGCYDRLRQLAVLFEDYGILKERIYFALKHPAAGGNAGADDEACHEAVLALSELIESGRYLLRIARAGNDLGRARQRLEAAIGQANATYQQVKTSIPRTHTDGSAMMTAYLNTVAAAKQLSAAAAPESGAEVPAAYSELGKAYYDCNARFWPLLYQAGTGMIHQFNAFSQHHNDRVAPMVSEPQWLKPLLRAPAPATPVASPSVPDATPSHIILLFDNSGSMQSPEKLRLFQRTARQLIETMPQTDRLSLVTFCGEPRLVVAAGATADRQTTLRKVDQLTCKGESPVLEGLDIAYLEALTPQYPNENRRIVMVTDGGFEIPQEMPPLVEERAFQQISLSIYYVGKDDQHSRRRLSKLAAIGRGSYHRLSQPEQLIGRLYPQALSEGIGQP